MHPLHTDSNHIFFWWTSLLSIIFIDPVEQILGSFRKTKFFLNQTITFTVIYSQEIFLLKQLSCRKYLKRYKFVIKPFTNDLSLYDISMLEGTICWRSYPLKKIIPVEYYCMQSNPFYRYSCFQNF